MVILNENNYESEVINSDIPVLVDFWAEWCMPCRMIAPVLEELEKELKGKLKIAKLNVDENPDISAKLGITAIPTLILYKNGKIAERVVGVRTKEELKKILGY